ncbi:MAG: hypothetical protein K0R38_795, partial [Polyangiaceae bacterium]|nr:hypothetical protein [Polyangiaceae bacterium]
LEVSAIQLRGRIRHPDGTDGHFHLQIVATGVKQGEGSSDSEIFRKVPDLDQLRAFQEADDTEVAFAIRGIGEFSPKNPNSRVDLDPETDEFGVPRAFVRINDDSNRSVPAIRNLNQKDAAVLTAMLEATNDVLALFEQAPREVQSEPRDGGIDESSVIKLDGVGTTYHEAGTLRFGDDPDDSVLDATQRFHGVTNAYVTDTGCSYSKTRRRRSGGFPAPPPGRSSSGSERSRSPPPAALSASIGALSRRRRISSSPWIG